ncbi:hypothetical protein ASD06_08045 [Angustibacter sp. Root456]|nr:hypothetical protein ASD06_08045 [Angustibacter sp. Root456]
MMLALTACSSGPRDAMQTAEAQLKDTVPSVVQALALDTRDDSHQEVSRDPGLIARSVIYDRRTRCTTGEPVSCGALLEEWPSHLAAEKRADALRAQGMKVVVADRLVAQLSPQLDAGAQQQYAAALQAG